MIPLRDDVPSRTTPVVNYVLIAITALVFLAQLGQVPDDPSLVERYGMIPARVLDADAQVVFSERQLVRTPLGLVERRIQRPAAAAAVPAWLTVVTCIFLHGGWMHFLGNMWFLWIFGDNVEDRLGHWGYVGFYLGTGVLATLAHLVMNLGSNLPVIGASGAIAGVMGAYFVLYPRAKVLTLVPVLFLIRILVLPAPLFLGVWFLLQFLQGSMAAASSGAGVAWWAHIGGFVAGFVVGRVLYARDRARPRVELLGPERDDGRLGTARWLETRDRRSRW